MAGDSSDLPRFITREGKILPGVRRVVNVPQPAAGSDWQVIVPSGVMWRILGGEQTLVTDATAGNRYPAVAVFVEGFRVFHSGNGNAVAASQTGYSTIEDVWSVNTAGALSGYGYLQCPTMWLPSQAVFRSYRTLIGAGDQWENVTLLIEELYATDQVLSEWHEREMEAYRAAST